MQGNSYSLRMLHVQDFFVTLDMTSDELFSLL